MVCKHVKKSNKRFKLILWTFWVLKILVCITLDTISFTIKWYKNLKTIGLFSDSSNENSIRVVRNQYLPNSHTQRTIGNDR